MILIDTVYQKVLAIANKEQRGYITPQEFNLFADQAQLEIFEQYFYDLNQFKRIPGNQSQYSDVDDILEEKIQVFERSDGQATIDAYVGAGGGGINKILPDYIYRAYRIELNNLKCEILSTADFNNVRFSGPLVKPSNERPIANIRGSSEGSVLRVVGDNNEPVVPTGVFYFKRPSKPNWPYVVANEQALYDSDPNKVVNFELHPSEENKLIFKILQLAGITMDPALYQVAAQEEIKTIQQQKA